MNKIHIVGIGYKPLEKKARETVLNSELILTSGRLLEVFQGYDEYEKVKDKIRVINNVDETIRFIHSSFVTQHLSLVLLASGDPLLFGIGRRAIAEFGKDAVVIYPELSSVQMAFARIREPWDDALLISLHGGPDPEKRRRLKYELSDIPSLLEGHAKIAILTDRENNPAVIAGAVDSEVRIFICERLGYHDERITEGPPEEIAGMTFSDPNVVILIREKDLLLSALPVGNPSSIKDCGEAEMTIIETGSSRTSKPQIRFGLTEKEIVHSHGLITKDEVRAVTVHKLRLPEKGVFWDIGAGSGSVSIEVARLCSGIQVFAVEKDRERVGNIRDNTARLGAANMTIVAGMAPDALKDLPAPDRVFIGGSGGRLKETIGKISDAMPSGIIVINAITIETLNDAIQALTTHGFTISISEIAVSRSRAVAGKTHLSAFNPVFIITGEREFNDR